MIFSQGDIIRVIPDETNGGFEFDHVVITFPCTDADTGAFHTVDAIPCQFDGVLTQCAPGYRVGEPTRTVTFIHNMTREQNCV